MQQRKILPRWLLAGAPLLAPPLAVAGVEAAATPQAHIDRLVDETVAPYYLPGIAAGVIEGGEATPVATRGRLAVDKPAWVDSDSQAKMICKPEGVTGAVGARAVRASEVGQEDLVIRHLPHFRMHDRWVTQEIR